MSTNEIDVKDVLGLGHVKDHDVLKAFSMGLLMGQALVNGFPRNNVEELMFTKVGVEFPLSKERITREQVEAVLALFREREITFFNLFI